jgi:hypothetical protein
MQDRARPPLHRLRGSARAKPVAATLSQPHVTLRRLLDSQRRISESFFVATWQARRQIERAAQYLGELFGDLMPQEVEKNDDRNGNSQQVQWRDGSVVLAFQVEPIDPPLYSRLYFTTWRKSCRPSKPSLQMSLSSERNRRPSCCCQPQAGRDFGCELARTNVSRLLLDTRSRR